MQTAFLANEETHFDGNFVPFQRHISYPALAPDTGPKVEVNPYHQVRYSFPASGYCFLVTFTMGIKVSLHHGTVTYRFLAPNIYFASKYHA